MLPQHFSKDRFECCLTKEGCATEWNRNVPLPIVIVLLAETVDVLLYSDVYSVRISVLEQSFKQDPDPVFSAVKYLQESKMTKIAHLLTNHFGIAFVTTIGKVTSSTFGVDDVLIDSSYKSNVQKLELFVLMLSAMGVSFRAAYFFFQAGTGGVMRSR